MLIDVDNDIRLQIFFKETLVRRAGNSEWRCGSISRKMASHDLKFKVTEVVADIFFGHLRQRWQDSLATMHSCD